MHRFRKGGLEFLVATDVAARGIDVENVQVVFNYDLPYDGRTTCTHRAHGSGRPQRHGDLVCRRARGVPDPTHRAVHRVKMQRGRVPTVAEVEEARANLFLDQLRATLQSGNTSGRTI